MTSTDIALYLGMALENLSRELGRFFKQGLMNKNKRVIKLLDIEYLRKIADGDNAVEEAQVGQGVFTEHKPKAICTEALEFS